jgi:hypothetical protein
MRDGRCRIVTLPFPVVNVRGNESALAAPVLPVPPQETISSASASGITNGRMALNLDTGTSSFLTRKREEGLPAGAVLTALPTRAARSA